MKEQTQTKKILMISIWAGVLYGGIALLFGLLTEYNIIFLDGIFTLIGSVMSLITLYIAKFVEEQDFERFPFGKEALIPLLVFVQYSIILLISFYGIIESAASLLHIETGSTSPFGLYFSILGTVYCWIIYYYFKKNPTKHSFYEIELKQWRFAFFFSLGVVGSFTFTQIIQFSPYAHLAVYIDPIVAIGITAFFIAFSIKELKTSILELTSSALAQPLGKNISLVVDDCLKNKELETYLLRTAKVGTQIVVELDILIKENSSLDSITMQEMARETIEENILQLIQGYSLWLNINFVGDAKRL